MSKERDFLVNATITVNVEVEVSAENKEDAKLRAEHAIYDGTYECKDLENDPIINWAKLQND